MHLQVSQIRTDGGTQPREQLDLFTVEEYSEALSDGATFPPVIVFEDGSDLWLADGFHRLEAYRRLGREDIPADVRQGSRRDAVLFAVGANATHGLPRTNADKRRSVLQLLQDEEWRGWSDHQIARRCAVSQPFVTKLREHLTDNGYQSPTERRGGDGRVINTERIGRSRSEERQIAEALIREAVPELFDLADEDGRLSPEATEQILGILDQRLAPQTKTPPPPPPPTPWGISRAELARRQEQTLKVQSIYGKLEGLASPPISAAEFKGAAMDITLQLTRQLVPAVRAFLEEIERT